MKSLLPRLTLAIFVTLAVVATSGCAKTTDTNSGNLTSASPTPTRSPATATAPVPPEVTKNGWWIRVCTPKTEASGIRLEIGLGGNAGSHRFWRDWRSNEPAEFDVPDDFRQVQEIWIKGTADPNDRNVHMCTYYKGDSTQRMTFDASEEHETSQSDRDNCDC